MAASSTVQTWPVAMSVAVAAEPLPVDSAGGSAEPHPGDSNSGRHPRESNSGRHPREGGDPEAAATSMDSRVRGDDEVTGVTSMDSRVRGNDVVVGIAAPADAPGFQSGGSGAGSIGGALVALLLVVGLIFALAWLARRMPGIGAATGSRHLKLVGSLSIGPRERVVVVDVGGTQLLLSTGAGGTRTLHTLAQPLPEVEGGVPSPFAQVLAQQFGKKKKA